ncbi:hypothetical protein MPNT_10138 [Candidatus Methylacidithermus pantelleriae]|uniref:Uncharacterized protein n=1 Tax=Candidatus Methylacidithermus pantelleriae TaxID=2744239 RepID=A0A8J2BQJ1_9BACT|nr:hypothetical protein MPNT_10138 [Candidatus Methylacidithermus pantelleriae]
MKLWDWARANGFSYKTAWAWWKHGKLPVPARQMPRGTILVDEPERKENRVGNVYQGFFSGPQGRSRPPGGSIDSVCYPEGDQGREGSCRDRKRAQRPSWGTDLGTAVARIRGHPR